MDLSIDRSIYLSVCLSVCQSVCLSVCLSICLSLCLSIRLLVNPFQALYRSFSLLPYPSLSLSLLLSPSLPLLFFLSLISMLSIYLKGSNSARFVSKVEVGRTKTKQFCETCLKKKSQERRNSARRPPFLKLTAPRLWCFYHFHLQICCALQRRALFEQLNFQKCSDNEVFWPFVLRRSWKRASRHNSVHFFGNSTSKSAPTLRCFFAFWLQNVLHATVACNFWSLIQPDGSTLASLLFDPSEPQNIGKTEWSQCFATFYLLAHLDPLSTDYPSSFTFFSSATSAASSVHIVGSVTSKHSSIGPICSNPLIQLSVEKPIVIQWSASYPPVTEQSHGHVPSFWLAIPAVRGCIPP